MDVVPLVDTYERGVDHLDVAVLSHCDRDVDRGGQSAFGSLQRAICKSPKINLTQAPY